MFRTRVLTEETSDLSWVVTYHFGNLEFDDSMENNDTTEVILEATDFDTAVRYAQQYLRKKKTDEETAEQWAAAEILSVELH